VKIISGEEYSTMGQSPDESTKCGHLPVRRPTGHTEAEIETALAVANALAHAHASTYCG
jgi:hypothetical protein